MNGNHVDDDNDYSFCLFALSSHFSYTHTYIQNQKGSVRVQDEAENEKRVDEERNSKKRKGKEKKTRELASVLETNQSPFC